MTLKPFIALSLFIGFTGLQLNAQRLSLAQRDSLYEIFTNTQQLDSNRFNAINELIEKGFLRFSNDSAYVLAQSHLNLANKKDNGLEEAKAYHLAGLSHAMRGNMDSCLVYFKRAFNQHTRLDNTKGQARAAFNLGNVFNNTGPLDSAYHYYNFSSDLSQEMGYTEGISKGLYASARVLMREGNYAVALQKIEACIDQEASEAMNESLITSYTLKGDILKNMGRFSASTDSYTKAHALAVKYGSPSDMIYTTGELAKMNNKIGEYQSSLAFLQSSVRDYGANADKKALAHNYLYQGQSYSGLEDYAASDSILLIAQKFYAEINDEQGLALTYNEFGLNVETEGNFELALEFFHKALKINRNRTDKSGIINSLSNISSALRKLGEPFTAIDYSEEAYVLATEITKPEKVEQTAFELYELYKSIGQNQDALLMYEEYQTAREQIESEENNNAIIKMQYAFDYERKSFTDSLTFVSQKMVLEAENKAQKKITYGVVIALGLISLLSFFLYKLYRENKDKNVVISKALFEKDTLLREIHHRVKNNLQVISSLLRLQTNTTKDKVAIEALKEGQNRVQSMSLIHQNLYQKENLTGIKMKTYLENLSQNLISTYSVNSNLVQLELDIQDLELDVDSVVPLGLIINELITNALKYAFPDGRSGTIRISLKELEGKLHLAVADDGIGIAQPELLNEGDSFGYGLIHAFMSKLEASIKVTSSDGTLVEIIIEEYTTTA